MTKTNVSYTIINKNGEVVEDINFTNYDTLADHMLELADKWYKGEYNEGDQLKISSFDEAGELVYSDTATFGEMQNEDIDIPNEFNFTPGEFKSPREENKGFGKDVRTSSKKR
jgi:hypothetical protein